MLRSNSQFLGASVREFLHFWALGGEATLNLTTCGGEAKIEFNCSLGQPGAPHSLPPAPNPAPPPQSPPRQARHRGQAADGDRRLKARAAVLHRVRTGLAHQPASGAAPSERDERCPQPGPVARARPRGEPAGILRSLRLTEAREDFAGDLVGLARSGQALRKILQRLPVTGAGNVDEVVVVRAIDPEM